MTAKRTQKPDAYERITTRILDLLAEGVAPWEPGHLAKTGFPENFHSRNRYSGINVFLLASMAYPSPYWLTYLKLYHVFNAVQIDGLAFPQMAVREPVPETDAHTRARVVVDSMPSSPGYEEGLSAVPHYQPKADLVSMPDRLLFQSEGHFYKTLFHELAHSTGHESRLARASLMENKGSVSANPDDIKTYTKEELVAEMASAFLCAHVRLEEVTLENSAAYLAGWLEVLKVADNQRWIISAASHAQKAADFILGH